MHRLTRALLAGALLIAALPAGAVTKEYRLVGKVLDASPVLASYGVKKGARVEVRYTVDLATPVLGQTGPPDNQTSYRGPFTDFLVSIGTWIAFPAFPFPQQSLRQDLIAVADDSGAHTNLDLLHLSTPHAKDNDQVLSQGTFVVFGMQFAAPDGYASADQGIDQDPTRYRIGTGSVIGLGGSVTFTITGEGTSTAGKQADTAERSCRKTQILNAAKLCQSRLKCESSFAKAPAKDPMGAKLAKCLDTGGQAFEKAFVKTATNAAKKGRVCGDANSAAAERIFVSDRTDAIVDDVESLPDHPPVRSAWLGAAAGACAAGLGAEAAQAAKPGGAKLDLARHRVSDKLAAAAAKAVAQAAKKSVVFDPPADVPGFVDDVDAVINALAGAY